MGRNEEISEKKVKAFDLLREINKGMAGVRQLQQELRQLEDAIYNLEEANVDP